MQFKDYYKLLEVEPTATQDEIKRSYRKLAKKFHPDVNREANAEERFKEIAEAYEALEDPEKRKAYDQLRQSGYQEGQDFRPPQDWNHDFNFQGGDFTGADASQFSDFFETLFGRSGGAPFGGGSGHGRGEFSSQGNDFRSRLNIHLEEAFSGSTRQFTFQIPEVTPQGQVVQKNKTVEVKIPAGVRDGSQIRLPGLGGSGMGTGKAGDLFLEVTINPHPKFRLKGKDVELKVPVTPWEAVLGAALKVPTLGGVVEVNLPPGSTTGKKMRLRGRGLPGKPTGDQMLEFVIDVGKNVSDEEKALYQKMSQKGESSLREDLLK